jgi:hypothetical protein
MKKTGLLVIVCFCASAAHCQTGVLTYHNDNLRTGQNTMETVLNPTNVQIGKFGKLFTQSVDGDIYAQPLYLASVTIPSKGTHNVVFVATENDSVYAFDADSNRGSNAAPLWQANLIDAAHGASAGATATPADAVQDWTVGPWIGITATPAIDVNRSTMYVVTYSLENNGDVYRLHAVDITTGNDSYHTCMAASVIISGCPSPTSVTWLGATFKAQYQLNRPGLLISNGIVYVAFGSHADNNASSTHGWVMGFDEATLAPHGIFVTTPGNCINSTCLGSLWMDGAGLASDSTGNIFASTGNGTFVEGSDLADSVIKLAPNLSLVDYFTPFNQDELSSKDLDLGSGGVLLLPDQPGKYPHLLILAAKEGTIYVLNRDQMGQYCNNCKSDTQIVQELQPPSGVGLGINGDGLGMRGMPSYWNNEVYFWASDETMKAFPLVNGQLGGTPSTSPYAYSFPGANTSISSNGTSTGIVWSVETGPLIYYSSTLPHYRVDCVVPIGPPILEAYDALNISNRLYSSDNLRDNSNVNHAAKFAVPTVINGKVYVGSSGELIVYGPNPPSYAAPWVAINSLF